MKFDIFFIILSAVMTAGMILTEPDANLRALLVMIFAAHASIFVFVVLPYHYDRLQDQEAAAESETEFDLN